MARRDAIARKKLFSLFPESEQWYRDIDTPRFKQEWGLEFGPEMAVDVNNVSLEFVELGKWCRKTKSVQGGGLSIHCAMRLQAEDGDTNFISVAVSNYTAMGYQMAGELKAVHAKYPGSVVLAIYVRVG